VARYRWELALISVAAVWGSTFTLVQDAVDRTPPMLFLALRFAVAAVFLALLGAFRGLTKREASAGAIIGLALFGGYTTQTIGLQYTTASNAGFLTGMFVVFTPVFGALVYRRLPSSPAMVGVALATGGLVLLTSPAGIAIGRGDGLLIVTAASFAVHILLIDRLGAGTSVLRLAGVQIAVTAVLATGWSAAAEREAPPGDALVWFAVVFTAIAATAVGFLVQTRAQRSLPPVRTALILSAEPVFAGIVGYLVAGDRLGVRGGIGAAMILAGILVAELRAPATERL